MTDENKNFERDFTSNYSSKKFAKKSKYGKTEPVVIDDTELLQSLQRDLLRVYSLSKNVAANKMMELMFDKLKRRLNT